MVERVVGDDGVEALVREGNGQGVKDAIREALMAAA
jgi:hypothetical protein